MKIALFSNDPALNHLLSTSLVGSGFTVDQLERHDDISQTSPAVLLACIPSGELAEHSGELHQNLPELGLAFLRAGSAAGSAPGHSQTRVNQTSGLAGSVKHPSVRLTRQQWQVLELVADGKSDSQIASARGTTPRAVRALISRIFGRTNPGESLSMREQVVEAQRVLAGRAN